MPLVSATPKAAGESGQFQATILSQPDQAQKFQSAESSIAPSSAPGGGRNSQCEPKVIVHRDGDRISGIRVQCSCGQVIDLACVYQAESTAKV